jgi:hypothetical protein
MSVCLLTTAIISETVLGKHLALELDVVQSLVELVDNIPIIDLRNCVTVSEVPFVVVMKGLIGLLGCAAQIPSGFGTRTG